MEKIRLRENEKYVGIEYYGTSESGIGGIIKHKFKDFIVREITRERKILEIREDRPEVVFLPTGKYTTFNVTKVKRDTLEVLNIIAHELGIPFEHISYSGLKDHRAITVQQMSVKGNVIKKLKKIKKKNIFIRDIRSTKHPVKVGDNWGNHFSIVIRNIEGYRKLSRNIEAISQFLIKYGFPNYYGLQRFGIYRPNSHLIGKYILQKKYKEAIEEFLMRIYSIEEIKNIGGRKEISEIIERMNSFDEIPRKFKFEKKIIDYLAKNGEDYFGCLSSLSKNILNLVISAYQSYLFNKALSRRIQLGYPRFKPVKGDLIGILDDEMGHLTKIKYLYNGNLKKPLKKALKIDRAAIISTIIGYDSELNPSHLMSKMYLKILKDEEILRDIFNLPEFSALNFPGTYRPISIKPRGLKIVKIDDDDLFPGKKKIRLDFDLRKGSYATMLLREFMKKI